MINHHHMRFDTPPNILVLPKPSLYRQLFSSEADATLKRLGNVDFHDEERDIGSDELAERIGKFDVVVTGWRSPKFTNDVLSAAKKLKLIAHSAGSIRFMLDDEAIGNGFEVTTVAAAMASPVAEMTLLLSMLLLRNTHKQDRALKAGEDWMPVKTAGMGEEILGQRIGIIGAGNVGRAAIRLLNAVGADVRVFDPYLTATDAKELGATKVDTLDELLKTCRIISLHAPSTPQTHHMIGRRELALMRDGSILINTGRSWTIDGDALIAELKTGRISAGIDVFDEEPLPVDSAYRKLPNAVITPHLAAATIQCRLRQGTMTVEEIQRFVEGKPLKYAVTRAMMATMA
jgi:phosphoglycerate dehydrogenase-like enzyme